MGGRLVYVAILLAGLGLLAVPGCDSGGSGGAAATTGYSAANLAGAWSGTLSCQPNPCHFIVTFDQSGNITQFSYVPANQGGMVGTVTVDAAGNLGGVTISTDNGASVEKVDWHKTKFVAADKISGTWLVLELTSPNPTWDPFILKMVRQ